MDRLAQAREFAASHRGRRGPLCAACRLPEEERRVMEALLKDGTSARVVALWLESVGHADVGYHAVRNHRMNHVR